jgi:hypothetical protein
MDRALRELVRARALRRCEYCWLQQAMVPLVTFHVDHIVPRKHGVGDGDDNLALACFHCNLHKGPNLTGIDPDTGSVVLLFHPRSEVWDEHFFAQGARCALPPRASPAPSSSASSRLSISASAARSSTGRARTAARSAGSAVAGRPWHRARSWPGASPRRAGGAALTRQ